MDRLLPDGRRLLPTEAELISLFGSFRTGGAVDPVPGRNGSPVVWPAGYIVVEAVGQGAVPADYILCQVGSALRASILSGQDYILWSYLAAYKYSYYVIPSTPRLDQKPSLVLFNGDHICIGLVVGMVDRCGTV